MAHFRYLCWILLAALLGWASVILVIYRLDPFESTNLAIVLLFISLFIAFTPSFAFIGFLIRKKIHHNEIFYSHINIALRQGLLLSICGLSCLFLLLINALTWWSGLFIVLFITLIEVYISSQEK
ncbi:hypothetical protein A2307_04105 [Candidatus Peregrinibacteria bacterium RIFOXYB2_FULL_33_20]|nr:MAG: hypothetical protein A2263_04935 [Candidatus Peregrinibacteria bacterium RIFOXYA2_FULL_33_21]OGJ51619.1 MAG: hypothetical protein A2307_04105 [Candidatus Peregrinibacteria bacterium RIFOXYB2_FULL_33_20]